MTDRASAGDGRRYVGTSHPRLNLERFVRGRSRYTADLTLPRTLTLVVARSTHAHARLKSVDISKAASLRGVHLVLTAADLAGQVDPPQMQYDLPGQKRTEMTCLATDRVRYVGEPIAAVIAEDQYIGEDALDLIDVEYEDLPVVTSIGQALAPDAPVLHEPWGGNVQYVAHWPRLDDRAAHTAEISATLEAAELVVRETFSSSRVIAMCMESRSVLVDYDPRGPELTVHLSSQAPHSLRGALATQLRMPQSRIRVITEDVGGAFGQKSIIYPEDVLSCVAAIRLRRPVRWVEQRDETFTSGHARGIEIDVEAGFDVEGRMTAWRSRIRVDQGAYPEPKGPLYVFSSGRQQLGCYAVPIAEVEGMTVATNKPPMAGYRGIGQPDANTAVERVMDIAARRLRIDPFEIRQRNVVPATRFPYDNAIGQHLDSGDYGQMLRLAAEHSGYAGLHEDCRRDRASGRRRGVGVALFNEPTNFGASAMLRTAGMSLGGWDSTRLRMEPDGRVTVLTGQTPMGQGIETVLAQSAADLMRVPIEDVSVRHGDTSSSPYTGYASGASRAAGVAGSSLIVAADMLLTKLARIAAHLLDVDIEDIEQVDGGMGSTKTGARREYAQLAFEAYAGGRLPKEVDPGLEVVGTFDPEHFAYSYGVVVAHVDVDVTTGQVRPIALYFGHDCGTQLNPQIVEGQVLGGAVQGLGSALYERLPYDDRGNPLVRSLRDYLVPRCDQIPEISMFHTETPSPYSLNGAKGAGEAGVVPINAAILNAVHDALPEYRGELTDVPLDPQLIMTILDSIGVDR